ncbi:VCBS repeat-containing protein [Candidatus Poribacteria bacterium]|nr:VCBS repeat-containing protein [Candidatus Poribacteria bacterium]
MKRQTTLRFLTSPLRCRFTLHRLICIFAYLLICPAAPAQVTFTDVTEATGLGGLPAAWGAWGDYDNDGNADVVLTGGDGRGLYRNDGNGKFLNVTKTVGISDASIGAAAILGDFDNDGNLDLFTGGEGGGFGDVLYSEQGRRHLPGCQPDGRHGIKEYYLVGGYLL